MPTKAAIASVKSPTNERLTKFLKEMEARLKKTTEALDSHSTRGDTARTALPPSCTSGGTGEGFGKLCQCSFSQTGRESALVGSAPVPNRIQGNASCSGSPVHPPCCIYNLSSVPRGHTGSAPNHKQSHSWSSLLRRGPSRPRAHGVVGGHLQ